MTLIARALARIEEMEKKYMKRGVTCGEALDLLGTDLPDVLAVLKAFLKAEIDESLLESETAALKAFVEGK